MVSRPHTPDPTPVPAPANANKSDTPTPSDTRTEGDTAASRDLWRTLALSAAAMVALLSTVRLLEVRSSVYLADLALPVALVVAWWAQRKGAFNATRAVVFWPWAAVGACVLAGLAVSGAPAKAPALFKALRIVEILAAGAALFTLCGIAERRYLAAVLAAATALNVAVAAGQYLFVENIVDVSGLLDSRTLYGATLAAGAPLVLWWCWSKKNRLAQCAAGVFVLVAGLTILSAPMLVLFVGGVFVAGVCRGKREGVIANASLALLALMIALAPLPRDQLGALRSSIADTDAQGRLRRHAIERAAAWRALKDAPFLGHGPGQYQTVVGLGAYRDDLPQPLEKKSEFGTQPGYLVAAIEYGVPFALLYAALLLTAVLRAARYARDRLGSRGQTLSELATAAQAVRQDPARGLSLACAIAATTLVIGSFYTVWLLGGAGLWLAAIAGLCFSYRAETPSQTQSVTAPPRGLVRTWMPRVAPVALAFGLGLSGLLPAAPTTARSAEYDDGDAADLAGAGRVVLTWEAENAAELRAPMRPRAHRQASNQTAVEVALGEGRPPTSPEGLARYRINVAHHGRYRVWVRAWWADGCANSIAVGVDEQTPRLLGNDGTYHHWHWVRGPVAEFNGGTHTVDLRHREDGIAIDQVLLCNDDTFAPEGPAVANLLLAPTETASAVAQASGPPNVAPPAETTSATGGRIEEVAVVEAVREPSSNGAPAGGAVQHPPVVARTSPTGQVAPTHPNGRVHAPEINRENKGFVIGIAGCYRDGFEGHLVSLGIPYRRMMEHELGDLEALADVDLIIVSDPRCSADDFYKTLYRFLQRGGQAIVEILPHERPPNPGIEPDNLFLQHGQYRRHFKHGILLPDQSKFFDGVEKARAYHGDVRCHWLPYTTNEPGAKIYGAQAAYKPGNKQAGALLVRQVGPNGGRLYYMGLPAAFAAMWREREVDPYVRNILRDALGDHYPMVYEKFRFEPPQREKVRFSDDFMRAPKDPGPWKVLGGTLRMTGPGRDDERTFAASAQGASWAAVNAAGSEHWRDYRPMAAIRLPGDGRSAAGVWYAAGETRYALILSQGGKALALKKFTNGKPTDLATQPVPAFDSDWRRVALLHRNGRVQGFLDGAKIIDLDAQAAGIAAPHGPCGLCCLTGEALFDDVRVIDTAALTPGRDVAPGEESSERCLARYYERCFEKLSIYAPQWHLPPHPADPQRLQLALPLYLGGQLTTDEHLRAEIPAATARPVVSLPARQRPTFDLALHTPGWRDYHFAGRVTDWYATHGQWKVASRWSCSPDYQWFGGSARDEAVLWYKHDLAAPLSVEALMAPRAEQRYGEEVGRDLDLVICGNGKDLSAGYLVRVEAAGRGITLLRNGVKVAGKKSIGLPFGHALHHSWFSVAVSFENGTLKAYFDRRLMLRWTDPEPLTRGKAGIWTRRNKISLARATLSLSHTDLPAGK